MSYTLASDDASGTGMRQVDDDTEATMHTGEEVDERLFADEDEALEPPDVFTTIHR